MTDTTEKLEANKKLARDYIDQVFNQHNPDKAADFVTGDVIWHGGGLGDIAGPENLAGLLGSFIGALPDLYAAERDIIAENDLVVVRLVVTATVKGSLLGAPADGKPVRWDAVDIYRVTDGKISEEWAADDVAPEAGAVTRYRQAGMPPPRALSCTSGRSSTASTRLARCPGVMCPGSARKDARAVPPDPSEVVTSAVATVRSSSLTSTC
jgi:predicted ester cyclase